MLQPLRRSVWRFGVAGSFLAAGVLATVSARLWFPPEDTLHLGEVIRSTATVPTPITPAVVGVKNSDLANQPAEATGAKPSPLPVATPPPALETPVLTGNVAEDNILLAQSAATPSDFPDTPLGRHVRSHLRLIEGMGPDAEGLYQASLDALREDPEAATALLFSAYEQMAEQRYLDRWKTVDTLATLRSHASLEALRLIAQAPIPEERYSGAHAVSSRSEEGMIRRAAIRGLEDLARRGVVDAETELLSLVQGPEAAVREVAALAYLRTGIDRQQRLVELREALAPRNHWILRLQDLADVRRMPQPSPREETPTQSPRGSSIGAPGPARALKAHPAKEKTPPPQGG